MSSVHYLAEIARLFVAITLVVAVVGKLRGMKSFTVSLTEQFHVPHTLGSAVAFALIAAEAVLAGALLAPSSQVVMWGARGALVLFILFGVVIGSVLLRRDPVYCFCFGEATQPLNLADLLRNVLLVASCTLILQGAVGDESLAPSTWVALATAGFIAYLMSAHLTTVAFLLAPPTEDAPLG